MNEDLVVVVVVVVGVGVVALDLAWIDERF